MKRILIIILAGVLSVGAVAQTDVEADPEMGGRLSFELDKKITKGLHLYAEEELRFDDNFASFNRFHTTLGATYKVLPYLKLGLGYNLINAYSASESKFNTPRHRAFFDVTGTYHFGNWQLSLRERVQMTHRTDSFNEWQNPENSWMLKSRIKLTYKGFRRLQPYGSVELRNTLNAPVISATYNEASGTWGYYNGSTFTEKGDEGWFLKGFNGVYLNRVRCTLGANYRIDRRNEVEVYLIADYSIDKEVDANSSGKKLKAYTRETGFTGWVCASYKYSL